MPTFFANYRQPLVLVAFVLICMSSRVSASTINCPNILNLKPTSQIKVPVSLYIEGALSVRQTSSKNENELFVAPEVELINSCSQSLTAKNIHCPITGTSEYFCTPVKREQKWCLYKCFFGGSEDGYGEKRTFLACLCCFFL